MAVGVANKNNVSGKKQNENIDPDTGRGDVFGNYGDDETDVNATPETGALPFDIPMELLTSPSDPNAVAQNQTYTAYDAVKGWSMDILYLHSIRL